MVSTLWSPEQYIAAVDFAAHAHAGQQIPGGDRPYVVHVVSVAAEVMAALAQGSAVGDPDLAVQCALLHDTIEDTPVTYAEVAARFGTAVADGVLALTKDPTLPKAAQMADSLRRIRQQSTEVWMVKLADRITNLQAPPPYWTAERIVAYRAEAGEILAALGEADAYLAGRLAQKIADYPPEIERA